MTRTMTRTVTQAKIDKVCVSRPVAADMLSISVQALDRLLKNGTIPHVVLGRRKVVPVEGLKRLVQQRLGG